MPKFWTGDLPDEVREMVVAFFQAPVESAAKAVVYGPQSEPRSYVWSMCAKTIAPGAMNPWRKCHTENYWVYVVPREAGHGSD